MLFSFEVDALTWLLPFTIVILCAVQARSLIGPVCPALLVAEALLNVICPKFGRGRMPPLEGASTIQSAEDRRHVPEHVCVVVNEELECVESVTFSVYELLE